MDTNNYKLNNVFWVLSGIFLTNALIAEIIGTKIFSFEKTIGIDPINLSIFNNVYSFNLTAGVIIWPVVFITSDLINEYFGAKGVKKISYITSIFILYSFMVIYITIRLEPADFWIKSQPNINPDLAFSIILGQSQRIIIGSLIAFLVAQLLDAYVFQYLKNITGNKKIWLRATGSTVISQLFDSYIVILIAFYNVFPVDQIISAGTGNYIYKFFVAILSTPLLYLAHYIIRKYLKSKEKVANSH